MNKKNKQVKCARCGCNIVKKDDVKGHYHLVDGKPWCVMCRLVYLPKSGKIDYKKEVKENTQEKERYEEDLKVIDTASQKVANDMAMKVAIASQRLAEKADPKSRFNKKKKKI